MTSRMLNPQQQLFARAYRVGNINQSVQDIIDLYSPNNPYCGSGSISNNSSNNITIDYPRHYSPNFKTPVYLPQINNAKKGHSQEKEKVRKDPRTNANTSMLSQVGSSIMNHSDILPSHRMKRDKTQLILLDEKRMDASTLLPQINNITNINIHIYQNHNNSSTSALNNSGNSTIVTNKLLNRAPKKKVMRGNIKVTPNSSPMKNPVDNTNAANNPQNNDKNLDSSMKFLRDLSNDSGSFIKFLLLLQCHLDIEGLCDSIFTGGPFRRKATNISNDVVYRIARLINGYFDILNDIYCNKSHDNNLLNKSACVNVNVSTSTLNNDNTKSNQPADSFYIFQWINQVFHKVIKVQSSVYSSILITITQLGNYEVSNMLKNHFHKIIKDISNPLLNLFEFFTVEEVTINYSDMITNNLRPDFLETYNRIYNKDHRMNKGIKNSELLHTISKTVDKCITSIKYYSTLNLKYSLIKPYGDALNQLLVSIERRTLENYSRLILETILYGELDKNRAAMLAVMNRENNIKDVSPFLPPLSPDYKYTLVLDMDETLIHFFFTHTNGMFFVRPFCFDFLEELNSLYEIVTFTAGTKDYADSILNQLDKNGNIIKYRLYRQHTSVANCNVFKDLTRIGRDLSKTIIIDNLKENFKLQPNNGIFIRTWSSDVHDTQFRDLKKILKDIVLHNVPDVRLIIQKMNEEIKIKKNILNPFSNIDITKYL